LSSSVAIAANEVSRIALDPPCRGPSEASCSFPKVSPSDPQRLFENESMFGLGAAAMSSRSRFQRFDDVARNVSNEKLCHDTMIAHAIKCVYPVPALERENISALTRHQSSPPPLALTNLIEPIRDPNLDQGLSSHPQSISLAI
jgi:hypothetical protein